MNKLLTTSFIVLNLLTVSVTSHALYTYKQLVLDPDTVSVLNLELRSY